MILQAYFAFSIRGNGNIVGGVNKKCERKINIEEEVGEITVRMSKNS